jgi:hypothetical protein
MPTGITPPTGADSPGNDGARTHANPGADRNQHALESKGHSERRQREIPQAGNKEAVDKIEERLKHEGNRRGKGQSEKGRKDGPGEYLLRTKSL